MIVTISAIAAVAIIFVLVAWNLVLPISSAQHADFMQYARNMISDTYKSNNQLKSITSPFASMLETKQDVHVGPRPIGFGTESQHQVTLTFYVQYGNQHNLSTLIDELRSHGVSKAVFFVEKSFIDDRPFILKTLEQSGYKVLEWKDMNNYDADYAPTVFQNIPLIDKELLSRVERDNNAAAFLSIALHYNEASVVAFTPKIMTHRLLLDEVLKYSGVSLTFTDENKSTAMNIYSPDYLKALEGDSAPADPVLAFVNLGSDYGDTIFLREGEWDLSRLQREYPLAVTRLPSGDSYLLLRSVVIDRNAHLDIENQKLLLRSSTDRYELPAVLEIRGSAVIKNSTITSWDPVVNGPDINGYHPRPYIVAKNGGTIDVYDSKITHLGYSLGGISDTRYARSAISYYNTTNFEIINSTIAFNYYGFYSDHATDFRIIGNEIYGNTRYGLDPHTGSRDFVVDSNYVHDNGNQGIICSLYCDNVTITNNVVEYNVEGIGLHWLTNSSIIENNVVRYNQKYGIFVQKESFNNIVQNNVVIANGVGIGLLEGSNDNIVQDNIVADNLRGSIYMEPDSLSNVVENNRLAMATYSIPEGVRSRWSNDLF